MSNYQIQAIPDTSKWHPADMDTFKDLLVNLDRPTFIVEYYGCTIKEALATFHATYPIKCLDYWDIQVYKLLEVFEEEEEEEESIKLLHRQKIDWRENKEIFSKLFRGQSVNISPDALASIVLATGKRNQRTINNRTPVTSYTISNNGVCTVWFGEEKDSPQTGTEDELGECAEPTVEPRGKILREASKQINGIKVTQYGEPEDSFDHIAKRWDHFLRTRCKLQEGAFLTAADVMFMMMEFKMERECNQHKRDNLVDLAGYAGLCGDIHEGE